MDSNQTRLRFSSFESSKRTPLKPASGLPQKKKRPFSLAMCYLMPTWTNTRNVGQIRENSSISTCNVSNRFLHNEENYQKSSARQRISRNRPKALHLIYSIWKMRQMAVTRLVTTNSGSALRVPYPHSKTMGNLICRSPSRGQHAGCIKKLGRVRVVQYHYMPRSSLIGKPIWRVWFMSWEE